MRVMVSNRVSTFFNVYVFVLRGNVTAVPAQA